MNELAGQLRQHEGSLSSSVQACILAVEKLSDTLAEKLSREFQQFPDNLCCPPVQTRKYIKQGTLWFFLSDHGEDLGKRDGKPTLTLDAWACELQGKTTEKEDSARKNDTLVSSRQFPR